MRDDAREVLLQIPWAAKLRITQAGLSGTQVFERLLQRKVLVKNVGKMHALLENCLRVTVSTPEENAAFLTALQSSLNP